MLKRVVKVRVKRRRISHFGKCFGPGLLVGRSLACIEVVDARLIVELCRMLRHWRCCSEDWVERCLCS
jgi:hypothetical protein